MQQCTHFCVLVFVHVCICVSECMPVSPCVCMSVLKCWCQPLGPVSCCGRRKVLGREGGAASLRCCSPPDDSPRHFRPLVELCCYQKLLGSRLVDSASAATEMTMGMKGNRDRNKETGLFFMLPLNSLSVGETIQMLTNKFK